MEVGTPTLTAEQVEDLAERVRRQLDFLGDPRVRAPLSSEYRAERHFSPYNYFDFAVEIDVGFTVVMLRTSSCETLGPRLGPKADLDALAKAIMAHVLLTLRDESGALELKVFEDACRAKIKRERSGLKLRPIRFEPASTWRPTIERRRSVWVLVDTFDDLLLPYTELIRAGTVRTVCRDLKKVGEWHGKRQSVIARLARDSAVLEIEAAAEHAIMAAGRTVWDVVDEMIGRRREHNGCGQMVTLWGHRDGFHVSVCARDGCIGVNAFVEKVKWDQDKRLLVEGSFPDTVLSALGGKPLRTLVDHPALDGSAEIVDVTNDGWGRLIVNLAMDTRSVTKDELVVEPAGAIPPT